MKQFSKTSFDVQEDIQIQIPTARLAIVVTLNDGFLLEDILIRARLVSNAFGTQTIIERSTLQNLFEIGAGHEGFFRGELQGGQVIKYRGSIEIARGGALELTNNTYISMDVQGAVGAIAKMEIFSLQHVKRTKTYIHYNPVTINQVLQNVQLDRATQVVLPLAKVSEIQLTYPSNNVAHTQDELQFYADYSNEMVSVIGDKATHGYQNLIILPVRDELSAEVATRMQLESKDANSVYTVTLLEEKTL